MDTMDYDRSPTFSRERSEMMEQGSYKMESLSNAQPTLSKLK